MVGKRLYALRGAVFCLNDPQDIGHHVAQLYDALMGSNCLSENDVVSLIFSVTPDLTAKNPAAALRESGRGGDLALFSVQESLADCGKQGVIRVLLHCYAEEGITPRHAYLNGAEVLRPDRSRHENP